MDGLGELVEYNLVYVEASNQSCVTRRNFSSLRS